MKVLVFGHSGMLGHEMVRVLKFSGISVTTAGRSGADLDFDVATMDLSESRFSGFDYIINCIGLTTHNIDESNPMNVESARLLNTEFPKRLTEFAERTGGHLIQIATDCVFSGTKGGYLETDPQEALDVYGTTKTQGEVASPAVMHIRCSIIGREIRGKKSLLEWIAGQPKDATIAGFTDRKWNGVTTTAFSRVVAGIILNSLFRAGTYHLIPSGEMTKFGLVSALKNALNRTDVKVVAQDSGVAKDLTLATLDSDFNLALWQAGGYQSIPTIEQLIAEIAG
jgi:dTDP-4-dehydrorhamnose reductase